MRRWIGYPAGVALGAFLWGCGWITHDALYHEKGPEQPPGGDEIWVNITGHDGEVYVADTGLWVEADDHAAHMEHG